MIAVIIAATLADCAWSICCCSVMRAINCACCALKTSACLVALSCHRWFIADTCAVISVICVWMVLFAVLHAEPDFSDVVGVVGRESVSGG